VKQNLSFDFRGAAMLACALLLATACSQKNSQTQTTSQNRTLTAPTGATVSVEPEDGQWTMPARNYASTRLQRTPLGHRDLGLRFTDQCGYGITCFPPVPLVPH